MFGRSTRLLAASVTLAIVGLTGAAGAQSASAQSISNEFGTLKVSKVTGEARNGATFAGRYNVKRFVTTDTGRTKAVGTLKGTMTKKNGDTDRVTKRGVKFLVRPAASSVTGLPPAPGTVAPSVVGCEILDLVLGPLDLNLLGLLVHLDRLRLTITAVRGGGILGDLLCGLAGGTPGAVPTMRGVAVPSG
jgi:hypothetical protein